MNGAPPGFAVGCLTSKDGTRICYRRLGQGPGVILLHGGMESAASHMELAEALADTYTVYLPDRRGRGMSGPYGNDYTVQREIEDMDALLTKTGAHHVFGISSGAIVWLHAMLVLPTIYKAAIYEPPLAVNGTWSGSWTPSGFLRKYDQELARGDVPSALALGLKAIQMGPPIMARMPHWLLKAGTRMMMAREDKKAREGDVTMRELAPTLHYDTQLLIESEDLRRFRDIKAKVLLMSGERSPDYLKTAVTALEKTLPNLAGRVDLPGVAHGGSSNRNRGGKPKIVAAELHKFFSE